MRIVTLCFCLILGGLASLTAQISELQLENTKLDVRILAQDLVIPYDLVWGPDNWIWFTEREGNIKRLNPETGEIQLIHHVDEVYESVDNSGMYALALHPDFPEEPYVYVVYTYSVWDVRLTRFTYDPLFNSLKDPFFLIERMDGSITHNGARLLFTPDKKLLFSMGDALRDGWGQKMDQPQGKILRMNPDGSIPEDNPFGTWVWSYGHRNPQGLVLTPDGRLYSSEHGTGGDDELNLIEKGRNYGWPFVEGYCNLESEQEFCETENIVEPLKTWTPTSAPSGLDYYDHDAIPEWKGSLLQVLMKGGVGTIGQRMEQIQLNEAGDEIVEVNEYFINTFGRLRDVLVAPDGRVFISTSNREFNGSGVVKDSDDLIIELRNPSMPVLKPGPSLAQPDQVEINPNPAFDSFLLRLPISEGEVTLRLHDLAGRTLKSETRTLTDFRINYERGNVQTGIYLLEVQMPGNKTVYQKVQFI